MRWIVFAWGILSLAVLLGAVIFGGMAYPGYDHARQYISELGATGAPTQAAVSIAFVVSGALLIAFWLGVIALLPRTPLLISGALCGAANALGMTLAGVFPCDFECSRDAPSPAAMLHDLFGGLGYLAAIISLGLLAAASRQWPAGRFLMPIGVICTVAAVIGLGGIVAESDLRGLEQRVLEVAVAVFTLCTAWAVLQTRPRA